MEDASTSTSFFGTPLHIIVFGPASFVDMLTAQQTPVVHSTASADDVDAEQHVDSSEE